MVGDTSEKKPPEASERDARSGLSHDAIRAQLERILGHREFQATDKMRNFLRFVVEEKLAGRAHRLKGYTIATEVFGRGDDFDAAHDPIVRIQAGRLRRALERYYLVAGGRDPVFIDIPKGRYIPTFAAQTVTSPEPESEMSTSGDGYPWPLTGPTVAVLPLENLTGDPAQLFFTVGLAEDLMTEMSRFQDIVVVSCRQPSEPRGLAADPTEFGRSVGARFVLQGSLRRDPQMVKVAIHLTDARTGRQVWADDYSHPASANQLIATQERIAGSVVAAIASEYGIIARRLAAESRKKRPVELDTYEAMLRYYSHQAEPSPDSAKACFTALRAASEREPEYGPVWSALATLYCQMWTFDSLSFDDALDGALEFARRGVFLEPGSQLARMILAYASYLAGDSESFLQESQTALNLNPNSPYTTGAIGYFHIMRGNLEEGLPLLDRAIGMNPSHPAWFHAGHVIDALIRHDYKRALAVTQMHHPFMTFWDDVAMAATLGKLGRIEEARPHAEAIIARKPDFAARARELLGRPLKIDLLIDDLIDGLDAAGLPVGER